MTPNLLKLKLNATNTFDKAARRFKFNERVEAVDIDNGKITNRKFLSKSVLDWRKLVLTGMQGMPSPGPGEYSYTSEFGQYISERALWSRTNRSSPRVSAE